MGETQLHLISTGRQPVGRFARIAKEIQAYVDFFHLREKHLSARQLYQAVTLLIENGIPPAKIIINDRVDVAWAVKAYGVQLAFHSLDVKVVKHSFPEMAVGASVHSLKEAREAFQDGADFGIFGHIFETSSKPGLAPKGLEELKCVTANTNLPIIAIGGIKPSNCREVIQAGAHGIAVMSGILEAENPLQKAKEYRQYLGGRNS
ncbi:transcriptional regulator [Mesobacillus campisalis]|uniref:Transcriptional regulator n=1 Tax=Mesobacillus campisalis TaxID=1408103 RepID=A0A0M2STT5_9BACI|nr:thiazole tautomerase TenI [Mesobacillus campisalis]KKK37126.1 transcriptional regulator [Mesobacillus campisalis]